MRKVFTAVAFLALALGVTAKAGPGDPMPYCTIACGVLASDADNYYVNVSAVALSNFQDNMTAAVWIANQDPSGEWYWMQRADTGDFLGSMPIRNREYGFNWTVTIGKTTPLGKQIAANGFASVKCDTIVQGKADLQLIYP